MRELHQHTKRTARKPHRCNECGIAIEPKTIYMMWHGVSEGTGYSAKVCLECDLVQAAIYWSVDQDDEGPYLSGLAEWIQNCEHARMGCEIARGWTAQTADFEGIGPGWRRAYIQEALRTMPAKLKARVLAERDGKPHNPETVLCPLTASAVKMMEERR